MSDEKGKEKGFNAEESVFPVKALGRSLEEWGYRSRHFPFGT